MVRSDNQKIKGAAWELRPFSKFGLRTSTADCWLLLTSAYCWSELGGGA